MTQVLVVQHLISLPHAVRIMRVLGQKKHRGLEYYFELRELLCDLDAAVKSNICDPYADYGGYKGMQDAYILRVYRDV